MQKNEIDTTPGTSSGSADRAFVVLELLSARARPLPTAVLARDCAIPRSSLHRLLSGLRGRGLVIYDEVAHVWSLGPGAARLAKGLVTLEEAVTVLAAFDRDTIQLDSSELAHRSGLDEQRVRLAACRLERHRLLVRRGKTYSLGPRLAAIAARFEPLEELRSTARAALVQLRDHTGETASLLIRDGDEALYVDQVQSRHALRHAGWAGRTIPLAGTAAGAALTHPATGPHIVSDGVEQGVTAVANAIAYPPIGAAAISVIAPTVRLDGAVRREAARAVEEAAHAVTASLAGHD